MSEAILILTGIVERITWVVMAGFVWLCVLSLIVRDLYKRTKK